MSKQGANQMTKSTSKEPKIATYKGVDILYNIQNGHLLKQTA